VTVEGVTVLVVDGDEPSRASLLAALRRLGLRALGVASAGDAEALLESLDADVTLVHGDEDAAALARLAQRARVVRLARGTPLDEAAGQLLQALGRPDEGALIN
jgi:hypothetical protein